MYGKTHTTPLLTLIALAWIALLGGNSRVRAQDDIEYFAYDPKGIDAFGLHGKGVHFWKKSTCGLETLADRTATIRLHGHWQGATQHVLQTCDALPSNGSSNVVRDDTYVYFFEEGELRKKAVNATESDPSQPVKNVLSTRLNGEIKSAYLDLHDGELYWSIASDQFKFNSFYSLDTTSNELDFQFHAGGDRVAKMKRFSYREGGLLGGAIKEAIIWLNTDGELVLRDLDDPDPSYNVLAESVTDFAIHTRRPPLTLHTFTSIYATRSPAPFGIPAFGAELLHISPATGSATVVFTTSQYETPVSGTDQFLGVTTDSHDDGSGGKNIYVAVRNTTAPAGTSVAPVRIYRHSLPVTQRSGSLDLFVDERGGSFMRSDDQCLYFTDDSGKRILGRPTNAPPIERDMAADTLEIVQAIQNLNHDTMLVANKTTFVRA